MKTLTQRTLSRASSINSYERIIYLLNQIYYFMKLNKILMVLAATAIVGCTSDDLNDFTANQAVEDSRLIELNSDFVLAGVGEGGVATRTHWEQDAETKGLVNKFLPIWNDAPAANHQLDADADLEKQAVGLCWLGETTGANVYTNYQFFHFGWLNNGETEADVDNCTPFKLYNGALYSDLKHTDAGTAKGEADETKFAYVSGTGTPSDDLNFNSGVYKTENKTIFGGKYIVYYPYNPDFQETGTIPAVATTAFNWDPTAGTGDTYESAWLGEATFRYSAPVTIDGGMNAANFGLYNLSTLVRVRVSTATAADPYKGNNIDKVVLYSPSGKFVKQANLAADKIAAGQKGAELYAEKEGTKTVTTAFTADTKLDVKKSTTVSAYITVLPTTVDDLVALVHNKTNNFWYSVEMPATEFKAGNGQVVDITVKESDITSDFVAVDDASLRAALTEAEAEASESNPVTITVIGDIELTSTPSNLDIDQDEDRYITIEGGDIIVPQDVKLTITSLKEMKSTVRVLGTDCCTGTKGGRLTVTGVDADKDATILHNIILEETEARIDPTVATSYDDLNPMVTYKGSAKITIADDAKVTVEGGNVEVDREVLHKGGIVIGDNKDKDDVLLGAKVTVSTTGSLKFMGDKSTVVNNGIIEVAKAGQFNLTDVNNNSTYKEGARMTNNGKFIHNVDAGVGTAVQYMQNNGEYRCKVDGQIKLNNAYKQWTACNVIEIIADGDYDLLAASEIATDATAKTAPYKHNNDYIDIEITEGADVVFTNPSKDAKDIQIGDLTVTDGSLNVTYAGENDATKQRTLTVNGDMTVNDDATISSSRKFTVTENILINDATLEYVGAHYDSDNTKPTVNKALAVTKNIEVTGSTAKFEAGDDALNITCANFYLADEATAEFGNQTNGGDKTMTVSGTIKNPKDCEFNILAPSTGVIAWITCTELVSGGSYGYSEPLVVAPAAE